MNKIPIKIWRESREIRIPRYLHSTDAGFDFESNEDTVIHPNSLNIIGTGLKVEIPEGYEIQIRSRSGLSGRGVIVNNSPGTIDSGYRGEIKLIILNQTRRQLTIRKGDRLAQGVIAYSLQAIFLEVGELGVGDRENKGFGSTGS